MMNLQNDKEGSGHNKATITAAIIGGVFVLLAACVTGVFLVINTMVDNGILGAGNPSIPPTAIIQTGNSNPQPTVIVVTATSQAEQPNVPVATQVISVPTVESLSSCTSFQNGETRKVSAGTFVLGDITIDGINQYTDNVGEGTIAYFEKESNVFAQWGAGCLLGSKNLAEQVMQGEFQHGCGSACSSIRFVVVQSDGQQTVEVRTK